MEETDDEFWENARIIIEEINSYIEGLEAETDDEDNLIKKYSIPVPEYKEESVVLPGLLKSISTALDSYNKSISSAISQIVSAFKDLKSNFSPLFKKWCDDFTLHKGKVAQLLRRKGFESPNQLLKRIETLKSQINKIEKTQQPQLKHVEAQIKIQRNSRTKLLKEFNDTCDSISKARQLKIDELNYLIGPDIQIILEKPSPESFLELLKDIYSEISSPDRRLQRRDEQLTLITTKILPSQLVEALSNKGKFKNIDGKDTTLCIFFSLGL